MNDRDLIPCLSETSNLSEETCVYSNSTVLIAIVMNRRGNNNKFNENGNKNVSFDKDHVIPKEDYAAKIPEIKEFYNFLPNKEKASILRIAMDKHKTKFPFTTR